MIIRTSWFLDDTQVGKQVDRLIGKYVPERVHLPLPPPPPPGCLGACHAAQAGGDTGMTRHPQGQ